MSERKADNAAAFAGIRRALEDVRQHLMDAAETFLCTFERETEPFDRPPLTVDVEADGASLFENTDECCLMIADIKWEGVDRQVPEIRFLRATDDRLRLVRLAMRDPHLFKGLQALSAIERDLRQIEQITENHKKP